MPYPLSYGAIRGTYFNLPQFSLKIRTNIVVQTDEVIISKLRRVVRYIIKLLINKLAPSVMHYGPISYMKDGLITSHHLNASKDIFFQQAFIESRIEFKNLHSLYNEWRLYLAAALAEQNFLKAMTNSTNLVFIECGVGMGMNNYFIQTYLRLKYGTKLVETYFQYYGFDTFEGIDKRYLTLIELNIINKKRLKPYGNQSFLNIQTRFKKFKNSHLIQGSIPDILQTINLPNVNMLHIDLNNARPEVEAIRYFFPKMAPNSVILLDDYAFNSAYIQKELIDKYFDDQNLPLPISLPTGQGLVFL